MLNFIKKFVFVGLSLFFVLSANAAVQPEYALGAGDVIKISVFQNPDLSIETSVSENGTISYPLLGTVQVGGLSVSEAAKRIATQLQSGGFVVQPQVSILVSQIRGNQVAVLGQVGRPGRFPIETANARVTDMLALAGGILPTGADTVTLVGVRDGNQIRKEVDISAIILGKPDGDNIPVAAGDVIYVDRAPIFYIYGQVQHPGSYRLEQNMAVVQALAQAGGLTPSGTENGLKIIRHGKNGSTEEIRPGMMDRVQSNDVLYVRESLF